MTVSSDLLSELERYRLRMGVPAAIPSCVDVVAEIRKLLQFEPLVTGTALGDGLQVQMSDNSGSQFTDRNELVFTRRIFVYAEDPVSPDEIQGLRAFGELHGLSPVIYGSDYVAKRSLSDVPLAFISHDSRDKDACVRELAVELHRIMCPVWYDEYSLKVGDNLRESIDDGLKAAKYCILVLSQNFFANTGWGPAEFDSAHIKEMVEGRDVILPVWHGVTAAEVYEYNARLANKVGVSTDKGITAVAAQLANRIKVD